MKGTFITLLVGVALGMLLAPGKGTETIARLRDHFDGYKNDNDDQSLAWAEENIMDGLPNEMNFAKTGV